MGFFDRKYCDICGEKIGLLGNRKLEDGNLCKECAQKLSRWFEERRHSTVEDIKCQLEYRKQNEKRYKAFILHDRLQQKPTMSILMMRRAILRLRIIWISEKIWIFCPYQQLYNVGLTFKRTR